ncbi:MAG: DNA-directed RNA polymerase [Candidatus Methanomethylicota archaeon]|uniref:DNA-directed RNA polymerase subunit Rpo7 n=1 Tax=Thermoproteota archaeon TaxID=2056631 RepID=A0A497EVA4_9CREN|nr:MAG: DNA-directed RNA polymerase [Candidatus Verstraetearchaeota archaeon]RLE53142.1 MAG: DNA-directed RNA polymerase [Candidatus Verstraetearchaeota archaeon]
MYKLLRVKDVVRIPPDKFGAPLKETATQILQSKYEGTLSKDYGVILAVFDVDVSPIGKILHGDGASYHDVEFSMLTYVPVIQEVVEGEVVEVVDFGAFVRLGPLDGLIHVSQISDERMNYDDKRGALIGEKTHRVLQEGDIVRSRVVSVSLTSGGARSSKIGLTMRQPFLGKLEWIEEDLKKLKGEVKPPAKSPGKQR